MKILRKFYEGVADIFGALAPVPANYLTQVPVLPCEGRTNTIGILFL